MRRRTRRGRELDLLIGLALALLDDHRAAARVREHLAQERAGLQAVMMCVRRTPPCSAFTQASALGSMPPVKRPAFLNASTSSTSV